MIDKNIQASAITMILTRCSQISTIIQCQRIDKGIQYFWIKSALYKCFV